VPIHAFKLVTCYYKPAWAGLALYPVLYVHWGLLVASQAYFNTHCPCSSLGCWYPGSLLVIIGGRAGLLPGVDGLGEGGPTEGGRDFTPRWALAGAPTMDGRERAARAYAWLAPISLIKPAPSATQFLRPDCCACRAPNPPHIPP
jgi:hypothetical protein